jgi:hypothetical protein
MAFKMKSEYTNYGQLMNRIKELEIELKEQRLAAKFDREDKKMCNFLVDNIPDIIFKLDTFGKIVFVNNAVRPKSTANFLEPGGGGCELRVTSCEVKNFSVVFLLRFFKVLPRLPATVKHVTRNRYSFFFGGGFRESLRA